jgi:signal transduction histidine kinase
LTLDGNDELTMFGDEFNDLTRRLRDSEEKRRQFVSDASHELKTPLASIKLLTDSILQNEMDPETTREFVEDIGNEAERLNRMTSKLLSLTKGEADSVITDAEIIQMAPTIQKVAKMLSSIAQETNVRIQLDLQKDSSVLVREDDLYQIAYNLVENGIKYNVPGGTLTISLLQESDLGILKVTDTGMGIPPESQQHVFERFYRVDKARSRQHGGSGLGLAIVHSMVERNGGEIQLESSLGKGTTFTVSFPRFDLEDTFQ